MSRSLVARLSLVLLLSAALSFAQSSARSGPKQAVPSLTADAVLAKLLSEKEPSATAEEGITKSGEAALVLIDKLSPAEKQKLVAPLIKELGSDTHARSTIASAALSQIGTPALPAVLAIVKDEKHPQRRVAVGIIGEMGPKAKSAAPELIPLLADKSAANKRLRLSAVNALGGIQATDAIPAIVEEMKTGNWIVACNALAEMGPGAAPAIPALWEEYRKNHKKEALEVFHKIGAPVLAPMRVVLSGTDVDAKADALQVLGTIGPAAEPAVPEIIQLWPVDRCQINAGFALGRIGSGAKAAVPMLIFALTDPEQRVQAEMTLGDIGPSAKDAVPYLIDILQDKPQFTHQPPPPGYKYEYPRAGEMSRLILNGQQQLLARNALEKIATPEALAAVKEYDKKHP